MSGQDPIVSFNQHPPPPILSPYSACMQSRISCTCFATMSLTQHPPSPSLSPHIHIHRQGRIPFAFVIHLIIPGTPLLGIVSTFATDRHPDVLGPPPADPEAPGHGWTPFDFVLHRWVPHTCVGGGQYCQEPAWGCGAAGGVGLAVLQHTYDCNMLTYNRHLPAHSPSLLCYGNRSFACLLPKVHHRGHPHSQPHA